MNATSDVPSTGQQGRKGFTWLELVIVLAIIGILCMLLMKGVYKVRTAANGMTIL